MIPHWQRVVLDDREYRYRDRGLLEVQARRPNGKWRRAHPLRVIQVARMLDGSQEAS
jgi:hypothetical protein